MLFRAFASICQTDQPEVTVFFESAAVLQSPEQYLVARLADIWRVPMDSVDAYNCYSEPELLGTHPFGPPSTGDARLLETGSGGEDPIHYAKPENTLMLVRPATLARLVAAQQLAARLQRLHRTPQGKARLEQYWNQSQEAA